MRSPQDWGARIAGALRVSVCGVVCVGGYVRREGMGGAEAGAVMVGESIDAVRKHLSSGLKPSVCVP